VDDDERRARDGLLGLQLHAGPPMKIEFRNIRLRDLDAGTTLAHTDWLTDGGNPQRTAWQGAETLLSTRSAKDIRLLWKIMLDNVPREMHSLLPALVVGRVDTREGPKEIVIVTGVSDNLYAIDAGRGVLLWKKRFDHAGVGDTTPHSGLMCPGGITATPVIGRTAVAGRYTIYAVSWDVMYTGTGDGPWDPERGIYGNGIVGIQQNPSTKALELVDYFAPANAEWLFKRDLDMQVTPAIFDYKGRELMVSAGKECRVYLM